MDTSGDGPRGTAEVTESKIRSNAPTPTAATHVDGIKNSATANLTARVLVEQEEKQKRRKLMGLNENLDTLFTKEKKYGSAKGSDFMTRGYTIPASARR